VDLLLWIAAFALESAFAAWVLFGGGARRLEATFAGGLLVHWLAPRWSAEGIQLFVGLTWLASAIGFAWGLWDPSIRGA
jgi:hypothetical protein